MKQPIHVTFRNLKPSDELEAIIREKVARLETYYGAIMGCRVLLEIPHRHHQKGNRYHVRIDLTVPGEEIVVKHEPSLYGSLQDVESEEVTKETELESVHKHVQVAIGEAFDIARRRLQDYARRQRGAVKVHETPAHGTVIRIAPEEGWIETPDGREVYFHQHAVLDEEFDRLDVGSEVVFVEEEGEQGPQASTVRLLGKHHYVR